MHYDHTYKGEQVCLKGDLDDVLEQGRKKFEELVDRNVNQREIITNQLNTISRMKEELSYARAQHEAADEYAKELEEKLSDQQTTYTTEKAAVDTTWQDQNIRQQALSYAVSVGGKAETIVENALRIEAYLRGDVTRDAEGLTIKITNGKAM